jgi:hypothetical protein
MKKGNFNPVVFLMLSNCPFKTISGIKIFKRFNNVIKRNHGKENYMLPNEIYSENRYPVPIQILSYSLLIVLYLVEAYR